MTKYHNHHIVPLHMGGTDDVSNIVRLTIEEHAEAHRILYEKYNNKENYVAWKVLAGQMTAMEANKIIGFSGRRHSDKSKKRMSEFRIGYKRSEISKLKQSVSVTDANNHFFNKKHSPETLEKQSEVKKKMYLKGKNPNACKIRVVDNLGEHFFDCILDYANFRTDIKKTSIYYFWRNYSKNNNFATTGDSACIKIMERVN